MECKETILNEKAGIEPAFLLFFYCVSAFLSSIGGLMKRLRMAPTRHTIPAGINAMRNEPELSRTNPPSIGPAMQAIPYAVNTNR